MTNKRGKMTEQHTNIDAAINAVKREIVIPELRDMRGNDGGNNNRKGGWGFAYLSDADLMAEARKHEPTHGVVCELFQVHNYNLNGGTASGVFEYRFRAAGCDDFRTYMVPGAGSDKDAGRACKKLVTHTRTYAYRLCYTVGSGAETDAEGEDGTDSAALRRKHEEAAAPRAPELTGGDVYNAFRNRARDSRSGWTLRTFLHLLKLHGFAGTDAIETDPESPMLALTRAMGACPWDSNDWSKVNGLLSDRHPREAFALAKDPDPEHSFKRLTGGSND